MSELKLTVLMIVRNGQTYLQKGEKYSESNLQ